MIGVPDPPPASASPAPEPVAPLRRFIPPPLHLRPGEWVEVRSEAEVLATLDESGTLEALPFMPEMLQFCGRRFRVRARADRTVAEVVMYRRMADAVHLEGLRCDGVAHDGCSRGCLLFWKEAWLQRAQPEQPVRPRPRPLAAEWKTGDGERYFCQATELARATRHLRASDLRGHLAALAGEGLRARDLLHAFAILAYDHLAGRLGLREWNHLTGTCAKTPTDSLGLHPGERVRVKGRAEILATLDARGWNRRMEFSREMLACCGREFTVLRRMERMIRDHSGQMVRLRDTVILDGAVYKALNRLACPRSEYMFFRECWLERV